MFEQWGKEEDEFLIANYLTMKYYEISDALGRPRGSISSRVSKLGLKKINTLIRQCEASRIGTIIRPCPGLLIHYANYVDDYRPSHDKKATQW